MSQSATRTNVRDRTIRSISLADRFAGLADRSERIDTGQLSNALNTMAALTENTPEEFQAALRGMSDLSENIAARDAQLNTLLTNLEKVSRVLDERDQDIVALMSDADILFRALVSRREAIHNLLDAVEDAAAEIDLDYRGLKKASGGFSYWT